MKRNPDKVKITAVFLGAILCVFAYANRGSLYPHNSESYGGIRVPSSYVFGEMRSASVAVEKRVAAELAIVNKRRIASVGRPANALENLRFGVLEGKYAVTMEGDHIKDLNFIDTPDSDGSPKDIGNRKEFLSKYAPLFGIVGTPKRVSVAVKGTRVVETYDVRAAESGADTKVNVVLDDSDRLIKLHAQRLSNLKIF